MEWVRLGRTGLEVSVACLGSGGHSQLGQGSGGSFDESVAVVKAAIENGINFIDTAAGYGTEEIVGAAIKGRRGEVIVSTKCQVARMGAPLGGDDLASGAEIVGYVEESLRRLGTEYIDIMELHGPLPGQYGHCVAEIVPALLELRTQGKIRFLGLSERFIIDPRHEVLTRALEDDVFDVMMVGLNVVNQSALRHVLPEAERRDVGIQCMFAVRGKLASPDTAVEVLSEAIAKGEADPTELEETDPLRLLTEPSVARSLVSACYRFARHARGVDVVLTGTGKIDHLLDNIASINEPPLPDGVLRQLARVFAGVETVTGE
jgi:aryl-alcohol dehydrogenase-like predicted oxidoreductase